MKGLYIGVPVRDRRQGHGARDRRSNSTRMSGSTSSARWKRSQNLVEVCVRDRAGPSAALSVVISRPSSGGLIFRLTIFASPLNDESAPMNVHEYQAKAILKDYGVPVPRGHAAFAPEEAVAVAKELGRPRLGRESADSCRRPRQGPLQRARGRREGRRAHREIDRRRATLRGPDADAHACDCADGRRPAAS